MGSRWVSWVALLSFCLKTTSYAIPPGQIAIPEGMPYLHLSCDAAGRLRVSDRFFQKSFATPELFRQISLADSGISDLSDEEGADALGELFESPSSKTTRSDHKSAASPLSATSTPHLFRETSVRSETFEEACVPTQLLTRAGLAFSWNDGVLHVDGSTNAAAISAASPLTCPYLILQGIQQSVLENTRLAHLWTNAGHVNFIGHNALETATLEGVKAKVETGATLTVQQLTLKAGQLTNHGTLMGDARAHITFTQGATLINHHRLKMTGASQWTGGDQERLINRAKEHETGQRLGDRDYQGGHLWFEGPLHITGLQLQNHGLFQGDFSVSGALLRFKNTGTFAVTLLGGLGGDAFTVDHFINAGTFRGVGNLRVSQGQNRGVLTGERAISDDSETFEGLNLHVEKAFTKTQILQLRTSNGPGCLINAGTLAVNALTGSGTVTNKGTATFACTPDLRQLKNTGLVRIPSLTDAPEADSCLETGQWEIDNYTIPEMVDDYTLKGVLTTKTLSFSGTRLHHVGTLSTENLLAPNAALINDGTLAISHILRAAKLENTHVLKGSGTWTLTSHLQNDHTLETWGQHAINAKRVFNTQDILSTDADSVLTLTVQEMVHGVEPQGAPQRLQTAPISPYNTGLRDYCAAPPPVAPVTPINREAALLKAHLESPGKVNVTAEGVIDSRWGTMFATQGLSLKSLSRDILVGAYAPGKPLNALSTSHTQDMWRRHANRMIPMNFSTAIVYEGGQYNGASLGSWGPLSLQAEMGTVGLTYGVLFTKDLLTVQAAALDSKASQILVEGDAQFTLPHLQVTRDQLYWSRYDGYVPGERCAAGPWRSYCIRLIGTSPHDRSGPSRVVVRGNLDLKGLRDGLVVGSQVLAGGVFTVNDTSYRCPTSIFKVISTQAQQPAPSLIQSGQAACISIGACVISNSAVGGLTLDLHLNNLTTRSSSHPMARPTHTFVDLNAYAVDAFPGLTRSQTGVLRLSLPLGKADLSILTRQPDGGDLSPLSLESLSISPDLLRFVLPTLVTQVGRQALNPQFLETLLINSARVAHLAHLAHLARDTRLALGNGETAGSQETSEEALFPPNALSLPDTADVVALAQRYGSFLQKHNDTLLLHVGDATNLRQDTPSGVTSLYGDQAVRVNAAHINLQGTVVSTQGSGMDAIAIRAQSYAATPTLRTDGSAILGGWREEDVLVQPTIFMAPEGGIAITTQGPQYHVAALMGAKKQIDLTSAQSLVALGTQGLQTQTMRSETRKGRGLFGKRQTTTHFSQSVRHAPCEMVVKHGPAILRSEEGCVHAVAPQIRASEILFDTPQGRTFVEMARHQVTHQSQRSSQDFFEKKIKRWGDQSITPQEARLTGSVRFTGMAPRIEGRVDGGADGRLLTQLKGFGLEGFGPSVSERVALQSASLGSPLLRALGVSRRSPRELSLTTPEGAPFTFVPVYDVNTSYCHTQRSLGPGAQALLGIGMTALTGGLCPATWLGNTTLGVARTAALGSLGTSALGNAYAGRPLLDENSLQQAAFAGLTAGLAEGVCQVTGYGATPQGITPSLADRAHRAAADVTSRAVIAGVRGDGRLEQVLRDGAVTVLQSALAGEIGAFHHADPSLDTHLLSFGAHGALGASAAGLMGEDPLAGATGAVIGELTGIGLKKLGVDADWGVPWAQASAALTAGALNLDPVTAASAGGIAARENAFMVLPLVVPVVMAGIGAGLTAYETYQLYQIIQTEGWQVGLKHLGVTVTMAATGGLVMKMGGKVLGHFANTPALREAVLQLPGIPPLMQSLETASTAGLSHLAQLDAALARMLRLPGAGTVAIARPGLPAPLGPAPRAGQGGGSLVKERIAEIEARPMQRNPGSSSFSSDGASSSRRLTPKTGEVIAVKPTQVTIREQKQLLPEEGKVGTYGELSRTRKYGSNLAGHHMPNDQYMSTKGVSRNDGVAMRVEHPVPGTGGRHREIHRELQKQDPALHPRQALAQSVQKAREVYAEAGLKDEIRGSLREVIRTNKEFHPELFSKKD